MNSPEKQLQFQQVGGALSKDLLCSLDIGARQISCFVAERTDGGLGVHHQIRIVGTAYQLSRGIKNGMVTDMSLAESSIRNVISLVEKQIGKKVKEVTIGITHPHMESYTRKVCVDLYGYEVTHRHMEAALSDIRKEYRNEYWELLHVIPVSYTVDDSESVLNPRGLFGKHLYVTVHVVRVPVNSVRNFLACVENCHLEINQLVAIPYVSALSVLSKDEMDLGAMVIDMGCRTTGFSIFYESMPVYIGVIPMGGQHITLDIAYGLNISVVEAERIKILYGSSLIGKKDGEENFQIESMDETGRSYYKKVSYTKLAQIIRPRLEEIFELLQEKIEISHWRNIRCRRIVLTGGSAQFSGIREVAHQILEKEIRIGVPLHFQGLPAEKITPAFSACAGILAYKFQNYHEGILYNNEGDSLWKKVKNWCAEYF